MKRVAILLVIGLVGVIIPHLALAERTLPPTLAGFSQVAIKNIKCNDSLQLIGKRENGSPACVYHDTFSKLILRGWGYDPIHELTFEGLNDTYKVGQRFNDFVIKFQGYGVGPGCDFPNVMINDADGKTVWQDAFGICSPPVGGLPYFYYEHEWNGTDLSTISVNKTGSYTIVAQLYTTTTKNITIIP
jgi:hypothetical protein